MNIGDILNVPIGYIIKFCYDLIPNYAVALLLFAILVKLLLFPLSIKQQKNLVKQAKLQPRIDAIRKRYQGRTDQATQQKMNQEMMDLYQKEGYNPMGGCLPMLIQLPILFSLYHVIIDPLKYICRLSAESISAIETKAGELLVALQNGTFTPANAIPEAFMTKLEGILEKGQDLFNTLNGVEEVNLIRYLGEGEFAEWVSKADLPNFTLFGLDLSATPSMTDAFTNLSGFLLFMIPILSGVISFASMKLTRKLQPMPQTEEAANMNASMKVMDWTMPLMSVWIAFSMPAVIGVYWIYQNIIGTLQQFILKKMYPAPVFTEEEKRAIEREMNGKIKKDKIPEKKQGSGKKVRSLHHIDDEDFADTESNADSGNHHQEAESEETIHKDKKKSPVADLIAPAPLQEDEEEKKGRED